jgi:hypothetical protein
MFLGISVARNEPATIRTKILRPVSNIGGSIVAMGAFDPIEPIIDAMGQNA